jgi:hypothetical protein
VRDGGRLLKGCGGGVGIFLFERLRRVPSERKKQNKITKQMKNKQGEKEGSLNTAYR